MEWGYDDDLRLETLSVNGGTTTTFVYDDDGGLTAAGAETLTLDPPTGLVTDVDLGAIETDIAYDEFGAPVLVTSVVSATTLFSGDYIRDQAGRIESFSEESGGVSRDVVYTYDLAGRLETVTQNTVLLATYGYDDNGNRTSLTTPGGTITATYDDQDRLTAYDGFDFTYNENGEVETRYDTIALETTVYDYDVMGNLRSVVLPDATLVEYVTDPRGRRVGKRVDGKTVVGWLYGDQLEPVAELDSASAVVSRFVYGSSPHTPDYMVKGGTTYRILTDHVGSVRLVVNSTTGVVAQRLEYDEWGNVVTDTAPRFQPFGFAGGLYDPDTELVRFGARDYDPSVGRWLTKDPIRFDGGENLYGYVWGDPVNLVDPNGRNPAGAAVWACARNPVCRRGMSEMAKWAIAAGAVGATYAYCVVSGACTPLHPPSPDSALPKPAANGKPQACEPQPVGRSGPYREDPNPDRPPKRDCIPRGPPADLGILGFRCTYDCRAPGLPTLLQVRYLAEAPTNNECPDINDG